MDANLVCCLCHQVPVDVVESGCCYSLFCWECAVKGGDCPGCHKRLVPEACTENLGVKKIIEALQVGCKFEGCEEKFPASTRHSHEENCLHALILCPNLCGTVKRYNLDAHRMTCPFRPIGCHMCEGAFTLADMPHHLEFDCTEALIECPNVCSAKIKRGNISEHLNECAFQEIDCPFAQYGCPSKVLRCRVESHISDNVAAHVCLFSVAFQKQQDEISALKAQLAQSSPENSGVIYQLDQKLTPVVARISNCEHPSVVQFRELPCLARAFVAIFALFVLSKLAKICLFFLPILLIKLFIGYKLVMYAAPSIRARMCRGDIGARTCRSKKLIFAGVFILLALIF